MKNSSFRSWIVVALKVAEILPYPGTFDGVIYHLVLIMFDGSHLEFSLLDPKIMSCKGWIPYELRKKAYFAAKSFYFGSDRSELNKRFLVNIGLRFGLRLKKR
ncbi:MAG: hypothetical protein J6S67_02085 [Methanobrevibacter sp.]|nr:hypothetical protein [Methanobrevibacter sp.]